MSKVRSNGKAEEAKKAVAPVPLNALVKAYLEEEKHKLQHELTVAEEDIKKAEASMMVQISRALGQREGQIQSLRDRLTRIDEQLGIKPTGAVELPGKNSETAESKPVEPAVPDEVVAA